MRAAPVFASGQTLTRFNSRVVFAILFASVGLHVVQQKPTFQPETGPVIAFDEAHRNPPTPATPARFELLKTEGYR